MRQYGDLIIFFFLTLLAEVIGTVGGFGSSLFFVSIFQFFYDFQLVLGLTGLLHIFSNSSKIFLFRKSIDWKLVLWIGSSSMVMATAGAFLTTRIDFVYARLVLGIFLIGFSVFLLWRPGFVMFPSHGNSLVGGGVAGFLAGFIGTGGAIRGLVLASFALERNLFVGTSAAIDFGVDLSRTLIYFDNNYFDQSRWAYVPLLLVASFIGSYLGKQALGRLSEGVFRKTLLILILLMGVILVIERL